MRSLSSKPRTAEATSGTEKKETLTYLSNANSPGRLGTGGVLDLDERPLEGPPPVLIHPYDSFLLLFSSSRTQASKVLFSLFTLSRRAQRTRRDRFVGTRQERANKRDTPKRARRHTHGGLVWFRNERSVVGRQSLPRRYSVSPPGGSVA